MISDFCKVQVKNEPCQTGKGVFLSMQKRLDLQTKIEKDLAICDWRLSQSNYSNQGNLCQFEMHFIHIDSYTFFTKNLERLNMNQLKLIQF